MPLFHNNGIGINYEVVGDQGSPVLLIMGFIVPGQAWRHQLGDFAKKHKVAYFDNRGIGGSDAPNGPYTMNDFAQDALALMDTLGWDRAHIVGVSMGGMIAQHVALQQPDRVLSLSLIATHAGGRMAAIPPMNGIRWLIPSLVGSRARRRRGVERLLFPKDFLERCDRDWLTDVLQEDFGVPVPTRVRLAQHHAIRKHDTRASLSVLAKIPTLVILAERDLLVAPKRTLALHEGIPGSTLMVLKDAGHGLIRQSAKEINPKILEHLATADERAL